MCEAVERGRRATAEGSIPTRHTERTRFNAPVLAGADRRSTPLRGCTGRETSGARTSSMELRNEPVGEVPVNVQEALEKDYGLNYHRLE